MANEVSYNIQVNSGNSTGNINGITNGFGELVNKGNAVSSCFKRIGETAFAFENISNVLGKFSNALNSIVEPGIRLDDNLRDLQAITGVNDNQLKLISDSARKTAKAFGIDASDGVESYKTVLSKLGPELAKTPDQLSLMGTHIAVLSKQMGNDTVGAANLLTTAMNQYGVSMDNPIEASRTMGVMMNIMSAAAQEGSAEMPQIQAALEQAGMMAKTANVSFAETSAAIQILDAAGKKGAEGGVAIRNVLAEMSLGAAQPKEVAEGMAKLGINLDTLTDKSLSFSDRLRLLKPAMQDQKLLTQMVGVQNVAATMALIENVDEMDRLREKTIGTNSAYEMADTKMLSFREGLNRTKAKIQDLGISIFNATKPVLPFISGAAQMGKTLTDITGAFKIIGIFGDKYGDSLRKGATATWGFVKAQAANLWGLIKTGVQYAITGALILGGFVVSLVSATLAQVGLNVAMNANPIGLIVIGVAAAIGAIVLLVKHWDFIKQKIMDFGRWIIGLADNIFPGFKDKMKAVFDWVGKKFETLVGWVKNAIGWIKSLFGGGDKSGIEVKGVVSPIAGIETDNAIDKNNKITGGGAKSDLDKETKSSSASIASGGNRPTNINIQIGKFQDKIEIHTSNFKEGADDAVRLLEERLLGILNSANALAVR